MRLCFLGTPEAAAVSLRALVTAGHDVAMVVTRPDKRRARGGAPAPSAVKAAAIELGLPVTDRLTDAMEVGATLGVVVAYGRIIKPEVLARLPMVNVHFSLLPRWRGAAPVERAILAGDRESGVCLMALEAGLDTGPVYRCRTVTIADSETAGSLRDRLSVLGASLLTEALAEGLGDPEPQHGEITYAAKVEPEDLHLNWSRPAEELHRIVRVGRAWTTLGGRRLLVLAAEVVPGPPGDGSPSLGDDGHDVDVADGGAGGPGTVTGDVVRTGAGGMRLVRVQPEGRAPTDAAAWLRGARLGPQSRLGT